MPPIGTKGRELGRVIDVLSSSVFFFLSFFFSLDRVIITGWSNLRNIEKVVE